MDMMPQVQTHYSNQAYLCEPLSIAGPVALFSYIAVSARARSSLIVSPATYSAKPIEAPTCKYRPAAPVALRLLAPQRGLFATVESKSKCNSKSHVMRTARVMLTKMRKGILPELSIGIGGSLTASPLPHHRTSGSASGGSED
jgi:hypothetical protein